jgi:hypothetical protein
MSKSMLVARSSKDGEIFDVLASDSPIWIKFTQDSRLVITMQGEKCFYSLMLNASDTSNLTRQFLPQAEN